jgi:hypothetical protein
MRANGFARGNMSSVSKEWTKALAAIEDEFFEAIADWG